MSQNNDSSSKAVSEQELDRLQIQWILGKNRGLNEPLGVDELVRLIRSKRLSMNDLSSGEKEIIEGARRPRLSVDKNAFLSAEKSGAGDGDGLMSLVGGAVQDNVEIVEKIDESKDALEKADLLLYAIHRLTASLMIDEYMLMSWDEWNKASSIEQQRILALFEHVKFKFDASKAKPRLVELFSNGNVWV